MDKGEQELHTADLLRLIMLHNFLETHCATLPIQPHMLAHAALSIPLPPGGDLLVSGGPHRCDASTESCVYDVVSILQLDNGMSGLLKSI